MIALQGNFETQKSHVTEFEDKLERMKQQLLHVDSRRAEQEVISADPPFRSFCSLDGYGR